jgi:hypothetical protein
MVRKCRTNGEPWALVVTSGQSYWELLVRKECGW